MTILECWHNMMLVLFLQDVDFINFLMEIHELTLDENVKINSEGTISEVDWK